MPWYQQIAWAPICIGLSAFGGLIAFLVFRSRGKAAGVRVLGWALLPLAIWLTGLATLLSTVIGAVLRWAGDLVFAPRVWAGVALFFVSFVLLGGANWVRRRRRAAKIKAGEEAGAGEVKADKSAAKPEQKTQPQPKAVEKSKKGGDDPLAGFEDIDAILKKRGIS
jgi:hypothetical protein